MTTTSDRRPTESEPAADDGFVSLELDDGAMIYDVDNETAWIQSDTTVAMDSMD